MSLQTNLAAAIKAVSYTQNVMVWGGASNKPEDIQANQNIPKRWVGFNPPVLTAQSVDQLRGQMKPQRDALKGFDQVLFVAEVTESKMIGNCGEQSSIACKFLYSEPGIDRFVLAGLGDNHEFVVIGASSEQVRGVWSVSSPPGWPADAVICDPWYGHAFAVASDWHHHIPLILQKTEPAWNQYLQVKVTPRHDLNWNENRLYQSKAEKS
jgi:hypothetical protein